MSTIEPRDPAPSRIKYKLERMWLTPVYRSLIRTGLPIAVIFGFAVNHFQDPETKAQLAESVTNARKMIEERPEFAVNLMRIEGATTDVAQQVREAVPMVFPVSSLRLNLPELRTKIEAVDAVSSVDVFLRNGVLDVEITERTPKLVWRNDGQIFLLDGDGIQSGVISTRMTRSDLPLIVGEGAEKKAPEALSILNAAAPLAARVRGLQRIGERRWDVVLDRGQRIQLPTDQPVAALQRVIALHRARDLLSRDVVLVDMRDGHRPIVRLSDNAMAELYRLRKISDGDDT